MIHNFLIDSTLFPHFTQPGKVVMEHVVSVTNELIQEFMSEQTAWPPLPTKVSEFDVKLVEATRRVINAYANRKMTKLISVLVERDEDTSFASLRVSWSLPENQPNKTKH